MIDPLCTHTLSCWTYLAALRPFPVTIPITLQQITEWSLIYFYDFQRVN